MKLTKEEALKKIEELKKHVADEEVKETNGYIIRNRYDNSEIYVSRKDNVRDAVIEAVEKDVNLSEADLSEADLSEAELHNAKFYGRGGTIKLKKNQVEDFLNALGFQIER